MVNAREALRPCAVKDVDAAADVRAMHGNNSLTVVAPPSTTKGHLDLTSVKNQLCIARLPPQQRTSVYSCTIQNLAVASATFGAVASASGLLVNG